MPPEQKTRAVLILISVYRSQGQCLLRGVREGREEVRVRRRRQVRHHLDVQAGGHPQVLAQRRNPVPGLQSRLSSGELSQWDMNS